jgi:hypothetical protein
VLSELAFRCIGVHCREVNFSDDEHAEHAVDDDVYQPAVGVHPVAYF